MLPIEVHLLLLVIFNVCSCKPDEKTDFELGQDATRKQNPQPN